MQVGKKFPEVYLDGEARTRSTRRPGGKQHDSYKSNSEESKHKKQILTTKQSPPRSRSGSNYTSSTTTSSRPPSESGMQVIRTKPQRHERSSVTSNPRPVASKRSSTASSISRRSSHKQPPYKQRAASSIDPTCGFPFHSIIPENDLKRFEHIAATLSEKYELDKEIYSKSLSNASEEKERRYKTNHPDDLVSREISEFGTSDLLEEDAFFDQ